MIEETAIVQAVDERSIKVLTTQRSGCHKCSESSLCSTSILSRFFADKEIELTLFTDLSLKVGDKVLLGIEEKVLMRLTFLIYFIPLCALFVFAILGEFIAQKLNIDTELLTILFAMTGFSCCYFFVKWFIKNYVGVRKIQPTVLKKL
ncbi:MAG: hypothetical protein A6F72_05395 [Cycloclasticus sp. symbiont of Poecilosclerida sp. N]|nr:MAG: hypothetical protein A6F72_05395 [Cycloclasticus sp. symbiont of Poecilosclerida sp. N]